MEPVPKAPPSEFETPRDGRRLCDGRGRKGGLREDHRREFTRPSSRSTGENVALPNSASRLTDARGLSQRWNTGGRAVASLPARRRAMNAPIPFEAMLARSLAPSADR